MSEMPRDEFIYDDQDEEPFCWQCGGDRWIDSDDLGDPLWYGLSHPIVCPCCGGSGLAKDQSYG